MTRRSLGANRPRSGYGLEGKAIAARLKRHAELMAQHIAAGMSREEASRRALREVSGRK